MGGFNAWIVKSLKQWIVGRIESSGQYGGFKVLSSIEDLKPCASADNKASSVACCLSKGLLIGLNFADQ